MVKKESLNKCEHWWMRKIYDEYFSSFQIKLYYNNFSAITIKIPKGWWNT